MVALWREVLPPVSGSIGVDDNFFDLGGNSLIGIDLIASLRKTFHQETLPAYMLYETPTVGAMAQYISKGSNTMISETSHERGEKRRANLRQRIYTNGRRK